jgi:hypothetical protein
MPRHIYRIRKSFVIPLTIDCILLFVLMAMAWLDRSPSLERGVITVFFLLALFVLIEAARRGIAISDEGLKINKFFKIKNLLWTDITHIGCLVLRSRVYILLTTTKGFHILSNAYEGFPRMVGDLLGHIPADTIEVEAEARAQCENPVRNTADLIAVWVAAVVLAGIICVKLFS